MADTPDPAPSPELSEADAEKKVKGWVHEAIQESLTKPEPPKDPPTPKAKPPRSIFQVLMQGRN